MTAQIELIEKLLEKAKNFEDGFFAREFECKISEINNFNFPVAIELSNLREIIFTEKRGFNEVVLRSEEFTVPLLKIDHENDSLKFYPIALNNYINKHK